ncbi:ATP-dependent DNA helicase, partial [Caligus rogercresseyi]
EQMPPLSHSKPLRVGLDPQEYIGRSNCCDNCDRSADGTGCGDEMIEFAEDAKLFLQTFALTSGKFGLGLSCAIVRGLKEKNVNERHMSSPIFGLGKKRQKSYWMALGRSLVEQGLVSENKVEGRGSFKYSYNTYDLTSKGSFFLKNKEASLKLIPTSDLKPLQKKAATLIVTPASLPPISSEEDKANNSLNLTLIKLRSALAERDGVAPYMILSEQTLRSLAVIRPSKSEYLSRIEGITQAKISKYGKDIVEKILEWTSRFDLPTDNFEDPSRSLTNEEKLSQLNETQRLTYTYFLETSSLQEESTIYSHLSEALKAGLPVPNIHSLCPSGPMGLIAEVIHNSVSSDHKCDELNHEVSWNDLKITVAHLIAKFGSKNDVLSWTNSQYESLLKELKASSEVGSGSVDDNDELDETPPLERSLSGGSSSESQQMMLLKRNNSSSDSKQTLKKKLKSKF